MHRPATHELKRTGELAAEQSKHMEGALFSRDREPPHIRTTDKHGFGAECERLDDVATTTDTAVQQDDTLVADRLLLPAARRYTQVEVAEMTGMDLDLARRFWRALGFPDVPLDERMFTDLDIEALVTLQSMMELGVADVDTSLQFARVIGSSMARMMALATVRVSKYLASQVAPPLCGASTTFGRRRSSSGTKGSCTSGGSFQYTSSPAPAMVPPCNALIIAGSSTSRPRPELTK